MVRIFLLLTLFALCQAELADHFKTAPNKSGDHSMRNIDFIYMINLDQRPEKFAQCLHQLSLCSITPYRFSAVNGWELSLETINDVGVRFEPWMSRGPWGTHYEDSLTPKHEPLQQYGRNYFCHCMSRGSIGIALSHLSILQDAYDSGYKTIWVMEDDVDVVCDPHLLSDFIDELDAVTKEEGWDILFTDPDTKNHQGTYSPSFGFGWKPNYSPSDPDRFAKRYDVSANIKRMGSRFGAYSMIVRRSGMEKILNFFKTYHIFLPYDIEYVLPPEIRLYAARRDIVSTQPNAPTDNGGPNYELK